MTVRTPDHDAMRAAASLLAMPPVPTWLALPPEERAKAPPRTTGLPLEVQLFEDIQQLDRLAEAAVKIIGAKACSIRLLDEGRTVKETALALGYPDTSKFVRSFRRMTGVTPGEYRRLAQ